MKIPILFFSALLFSACSTSESNKIETLQPENKSVLVEMKTNQGIIVLELDAENAPITTENFLKYVDEEFF